MDILFGIIIMLMAVLASNIINKFIPQIVAPIIQIILGILLALFSGSFQFRIESELLFAVFVAPLVYYSGRMINRKVMWKIRKEIANMAILLVVVSCIIVGILLHLFIPAVTIASGIVLIASLGPTDDVAIDTIERNYKIPGSLLELLKGESVFNDVSSIIIFQIGLQMIEAGKFSAGNSIWEFLKMSLGGVFIGAICSAVKVFFTRWLCSQGIVNQTTHVLTGILSPILIYCLAEHMGVSGILAIFIAGLISTVDYPDDNPDVAQITFTVNNFWEVVSFALEGLVFVILGLEIPEIIEKLWNGNFTVSAGMIFYAVLLCFAALLLVRFFWYELTMPQKDFHAGLVFALSGARGAVTMASVSSIPLTLGNGNLFPQRDLLITISMGVVILSIIVAHFILPFFVEKKELHGGHNVPDTVYLKVLQTVEKNIEKLGTQDSQQETVLVVQSYQERIRHLEKEGKMGEMEYDVAKSVDKEILRWKKECINRMYHLGEISQRTYEHFSECFQKSDEPNGIKNIIHARRRISKAFRKNELDREEFSEVLNQCNEYVYQKLSARRYHATEPELERLQEYEHLRSEHTRHKGKIDKEQYNYLKKAGLHMERDLLQKEYEEGNLTKESLNYMKKNITMLEMQIG